jgi:hypothetical protein
VICSEADAVTATLSVADTSCEVEADSADVALGVGIVECDAVAAWLADAVAARLREADGASVALAEAMPVFEAVAAALRLAVGSTDAVSDVRWLAELDWSGVADGVADAERSMLAVAVDTTLRESDGSIEALAVVCVEADGVTAAVTDTDATCESEGDGAAVAVVVGTTDAEDDGWWLIDALGGTDDEAV